MRTALMAFGIQPDSQASELSIANRADTVLSTVSIREDTVIEHDARTIPVQMIRDDPMLYPARREV